MASFRFHAASYPDTPALRWLHRFCLLAVLTAVMLLGWGAFVTSIDAGLAVPDWPTSFNSLDPFNPWPGWWEITPVLAEHGHRLAGALIGLFTLILAFWTWRVDPRRWVQKLGFFALFLVIFQGILGGLRVVWVSLDLAVVHACTAQVFFSLLVALTLFTSKSWLRAEAATVPASHEALPRLRAFALLTVIGLYVQIILGALLRHPGTGIDPLLAGIHIAGAFVASGLVIYTFTLMRRYFSAHSVLHRAAYLMLGLLILQVTLGFTAYFVLLDEAGILQPSNIQVIVNSSHLIIGALLMATAVCLALLTLRDAASVETPTHAALAAGL